MKHTKSLFGILLTLTLAACVTINIYFPAAAAEKAADKVIDEVWGKKPEAGQQPKTQEGQTPGAFLRQPEQNLLAGIMETLIPSAHAAEANINISSPAINNIQAAMKARHRQLLPFYGNGALGLTADGLVTLRDAGKVPLKDRQMVKRLVADENRDRNGLYRAIANANNHPEWESDIRSTFARRWIDKARSGWWYQAPGGGWARK